MLFPNELPSLLLERLFRNAGIDAAKDITLVPTATPLEAMQLLVLGRVDAALIPEPAASAAVVKGSVAGKTIHRTIDLQVEWGKMTDEHKTVPQGGWLPIVSGKQKSRRHRSHPGLFAAADDDVNVHPARAANNAAGALQMPWPVIEKSIPYCNLVAKPAHQERPAIEAVLKAMADVNPGYIGGRLPDAAFYL